MELLNSITLWWASVIGNMSLFELYVVLGVGATLSFPTILVIIAWAYTFLHGGKSQRLEIMLAMDRLGNALTGDEDENYISCRLYRDRNKRKHYYIFMLLVDILFFILAQQKNHCEQAYYKYRKPGIPKV